MYMCDFYVNRKKNVTFIHFMYFFHSDTQKRPMGKLSVLSCISKSGHPKYLFLVFNIILTQSQKYDFNLANI